ncbi:STAS domain-containing protein [Candidatus Contubernalis alkaliaceticus]|uniref:STAS domain-containing protein n=1 Tax=Candidatus Contubernalis alkaliaceticus TaxID=338645 RepID=UPI001F4C302A|nr:anti-sigma factor antagonist [Candidatus Contubernalis alkalaceticus]UNC92523.1 anti-sigma factor antagonist [Candidatus Contubernalis alkalaceticus]
MKIELRASGEVLITSLQGELDHHTAQIFKDMVKEELHKRKVKYLVVDMSGLTFMDSSGIGALLGRLNQLKNKGGKVVVFGMQSQVKKVFYAGGMDKVIPCYEREEEAIVNLLRG